MRTKRGAEEVNADSSSRSDVVEVCRGNFLATVEPYINRYAFTIRDLERERPVIHGYGIGPALGDTRGGGFAGDLSCLALGGHSVSDATPMGMSFLFPISL